MSRISREPSRPQAENAAKLATAFTRPARPTAPSKPWEAATVARSGSPKQRARRERQTTGGGTTPTMSALEPSALHEAGHAVAAHALGRTSVYIRCVPRRLPVGDPQNAYPYPLDSGGYHLSKPMLHEEVNAQHGSGQPLKPEHVEWLKQEAIIALAGPVAERKWSGPELKFDFDQVGRVAGMLGFVDGGQVSKPFQDAVTTASARIIADRSDTVIELATAMLANGGELDEAGLGAALAGLQRGSHRHLLATLPGGDNDA